MYNSPIPVPSNINTDAVENAGILVMALRDIFETIENVIIFCFT